MLSTALLSNDLSSSECKQCNPDLKGSLFLHECTCRKKQTVGEASYNLLSKGDERQSVVDTQREMQKGYIDQLIICAKRGEDAYGKEKPFYVCVQSRRERLLPNVIRSVFYHRITRPSPNYDLSLYWYNPKDEQLCFVWCIPDIETVEDMSHPEFIPSFDDKQLYGFVMAFLQGRLV